MSRNHLIQIACLGTTALCVGLAALMAPAIQAQRDELQYDPPIELGGKMSPHMVVLGAATGAFRGLFIDMMWYRADRLKQEGKFYEANQLSQWITDLQPRFAEVWRFHAWNMAYNISVATHTQEERWDWVNKGIDLLRSKGIPYNPRSVNLYRELSWIFFHKVGQYSDDMHWYYKRRLAAEWQEILGAQTRGATTQQAVEAMRRIAEAPDTLEELREASPAVEPLLARVRALGSEPDETLLREIGRIFMGNYLEGDVLLGAKVREHPNAYRMELVEILQDPQAGKALPDLLGFLRKQTLKDRYHMDPGYMVEIMELYGPLDWRHPAAQGAYWAELGMDISEGVRSREGLDLLNTNRLTIHAMQQLTDTGSVTFDPVTGYLDLSPDVRFIPAYDQALDVALERMEEAEESRDRKNTFEAGHENFLLQAVQFSYLYGDRQQAQHYYDKVRELYGDRDSNLRTGRYRLPLEDLVLREMGENLENLGRTLQFIDGMLLSAFLKGLANNRADVYEHFVALARRVHGTKQDKAVSNPTAEQRRMALLPFHTTQAKAFERFMLDPRMDILVRARVWSNAPLRLRQEVYDQLVSALRPQAVEAGFPFDRAFPEPAGMETVRQKRPGPAAQEQEPVAPTVERQ